MIVKLEAAHGNGGYQNASLLDEHRIVTLVFCDIQGSTAAARRVVKTTGDGVHAVFEAHIDGVAAALAGQQAITAEAWPPATGSFKVRMGLHTGESQEREGDYYGIEVILAARIMSFGYGGQVLISGITAAPVKKSLPQGSTLAELGEHRLKGIAAPEQIFQLDESG